MLFGQIFAQLFSELVVHPLDGRDSSILLLTLNGTSSKVHQLPKEFLGSLAPILNHQCDGLLLFFGKGNSGALEHCFGLVVELVEWILCGRCLLLREQRHRQKEQ